jgi:hypothetical protein
MEPEVLWSHLLSGMPELIRAAWNGLDSEERVAVRRHLQAMSRDEGWHSGQRRAALAALRCLEETPKE